MQFKRNLSSCTKWASKLKVRFYLCYGSKFILSTAFTCLQLAFNFNMEKRYEHIYYSPLHVSAITGNKTLIRFANNFSLYVYPVLRNFCSFELKKNQRFKELRLTLYFSWKTRIPSDWLSRLSSKLFVKILSQLSGLEVLYIKMWNR